MLVCLSGGCTLSHTPFKDRLERRRAEREAREAEIADLRRERPVVRRERPNKDMWPEAAKLDRLAADLGAEPFPLEDPCVGDDCARASLDRVYAKLEQLEDTGQGRVRILHLGDSHVAADYITGTARRALQHRFGAAGRGFVAVDQRAEYGGRRLSRDGWKRMRAVDKGRGKDAFGFAAMVIESTRAGARADFKLTKDDAEVGVFYQASRSGARLEVRYGDVVVGELETRGRSEESAAKWFRLPAGGGADKLALVADGPGARVFGVSFETRKPGVFYDAIGPVGADARVYVTLDQRSFKESMRALAPDLVVIMLGGNDALAVRKGSRSFDDVRGDHERMIRAIREAVPEADCMLWSPMDAAEMVDGRMVSKTLLSEVRNMQKAAASDHGCAFWDMFESMGGEGSFARWHKAGIMNDDLIHPRMMAGELLGHLFATSFLAAYRGAE